MRIGLAPSSLLLLTVLAAGAALGQEQQPHRHGGPGRGFPPGPPPHVLIERLSRMSPEERQRMLDRLPPDRRERVEGRLREFEAMSPEQREQLRRQFNDFQQLSPEKREEIRGLFRRFSDLPEDRRRQLGHELRRLTSMPPERRDERLASEQFKADYTEQEREMLEGLSSVLPRPPRMDGGPGGRRHRRPHGDNRETPAN